MRATLRPQATWIAGLIGLTLCVACSSGGGNQAQNAGGGGQGNARTAPNGGNAEVTAKAPPVKVTWQALARERYLYENPRFKRQGIGSGTPDLMIVLVNDSHPDADGIRAGNVPTQPGTGTGVISDSDMSSLLQGLGQIGYFKAATGTQSTAALFDMDTARGRVTVDRGGRSVTLLSMRGQGLAKNTKHIPGIYSQAKQAIAMMKNSAPTLRVETYGSSPVTSIR